jgi:uncharacterized repeat protein (TIGR01451 family)
MSRLQASVQERPWLVLVALTAAVVALMAVLAVALPVRADHPDKPLTFNQIGLLPLAAEDFTSIKDHNECPGVDETEDGWQFIHPPVARGGFTELVVHFDPDGTKTFPVDATDVSGGPHNTARVTFATSAGAELVAVGVVPSQMPHARGINTGQDFFVLTHVCPAEGAEIEIEKTAAKSPITVGEHAEFEITVTSVGATTAENVTIDDELPNTVLDWEVISENGVLGADKCSIATGNTLHCDVGDLDPTNSFSVVVRTTEPILVGSELCGERLDNTAFAHADNADSVDDDAFIDVECGAIIIEKRSLKVDEETGENVLVQVAGTVFSIEGTGLPEDPDPLFQVVDDGANDELDDVTGVVCVSGLAAGHVYTVNEVTPPDGYGDAFEEDLEVTAVADTDCDENLPTGIGVVEFINAPLFDIQVNFADGGSGETFIVSIICEDIDGLTINDLLDAVPVAGWDASQTTTDIEFDPDVPGENEMTITCELVIDP